MAKIFILKISESYPESYWFKSKILTGQDSILLKTGVEVNEELLIEFTLTSRASIDKVLKYDFFFSDGPNFISSRLHQLLLDAKIMGVQFLDADIYMGGKKYDGYKVFNITSTLSVFDKEKSKSEPILSYLPDGPQKYTEIFLRDDIDMLVDVFRADEDFTTMLASARFKEICELNEVRGLEFKKSLSKA
ncbi:imm11 family protein [Pseudomonas savastanoi]|uniref:imm11 family protein n=1 Tax=Pseudomonas savastanoi TaxID=29438 RepID=UPI001E6182B8|nr:DUF1629 domain-containing protein [Pseudomonas savastanoi]UFI43849.1 hypothetical protein KP808_18945 [Pseudomonas savastanoi]